jgi:hypothetical protein
MRLIKPYTLLVWKIVMVDEVRQWLHGLRHTDRDTLRQVSDALDLLAIEGPALGRPIVDRIKGSRLHHLKELRPGSSGASEVRILFACDPATRAVLLVAGDKAGDWKRWYVRAVTLAEYRYEQWIKEVGS